MRGCWNSLSSTFVISDFVNDQCLPIVVGTVYHSGPGALAAAVVHSDVKRNIMSYALGTAAEVKEKCYV